jgi:hypothetical protein
MLFEKNRLISIEKTTLLSIISVLVNQASLSCIDKMPMRLPLDNKVYDDLFMQTPTIILGHFSGQA